MNLQLDSRPKTIPINYKVKGFTLPIDEAPGYSCTPERWDRAERQESEYYDWTGYANCQAPKAEHPEYLSKMSEKAIFDDWEALLKKLEPLRKHP